MMKLNANKNKDVIIVRWLNSSCIIFINNNYYICNHMINMSAIYHLHFHLIIIFFFPSIAFNIERFNEKTGVIGSICLFAIVLLLQLVLLFGCHLCLWLRKRKKRILIVYYLRKWMIGYIADKVHDDYR